MQVERATTSGTLLKETNMATFVLVQGGWVGGWYWQKLIPFLEAAGHEVYAPTLTGLAERASELSPEIGLDTHIQDIVGLLEEKNLRNVILVGHSYGGMVITGVVDRVPERIAHLVYLDTFVPLDGESMADVSWIVVWILRRLARATGDGWRVNPPGTLDVAKEPDRSWVLSKITPHPLKTLQQPLHLKNPAIVSTKPSTCRANWPIYFWKLFDKGPDTKWPAASSRPFGFPEKLHDHARFLSGYRCASDRFDRCRRPDAPAGAAPRGCPGWHGSLWWRFAERHGPWRSDRLVAFCLHLGAAHPTNP
jgi:pimeloyl-ACP methyl ester carboxylesterase